MTLREDGPLLFVCAIGALAAWATDCPPRDIATEPPPEAEIRVADAPLMSDAGDDDAQADSTPPDPWRAN